MVHTKVFKTNQTQAVRLPKAVALPDDIVEVSIVAVGKTRVISPKYQSWDSWFEDEQVTEDFLADRAQPRSQERETL